jgi:hypothetical protein
MEIIQNSIVMEFKYKSICNKQGCSVSKVP